MPLAEELGKDLDPFDLICHVAFDQPPLTRRERAENVRKRDVFTKYGAAGPRRARRAARQVSATRACSTSTTPTSCRSRPSTRMGTPRRARQGSSAASADFEHAVHELQSALYQETA